MPTLTITREVGAALLHLQEGHVICKHWTERYVLCLTTTSAGQVEISDETFIALRKNKLIRKYDRLSDDYRWYIGWFGRGHTWLLSDAGKEFRLPPAEFWVEDAPSS